MRIIIATGMAAAALAACATTDTANRAAALDAATVERVSTTDGDPDEIVCKNITVSGSRLRDTKQCKTREQWNNTFNSFRAVGDMQNGATANGASQ